MVCQLRRRAAVVAGAVVAACGVTVGACGATLVAYLGCGICSYSGICYGCEIASSSCCASCSETEIC